jgi:hypothetical protein
MPEYGFPALGFPKLKLGIDSNADDPTSDTSVGDTIPVTVEQKASGSSGGKLDIVLFDPINFETILKDCSIYSEGQKKTFNAEYTIDQPGPIWIISGDEDYGGGCSLDSIYNGVVNDEFGFIKERAQLGYKDAVNINNVSVSSQDLTITADWDIKNTYPLEVYGFPTMTVDGNAVDIPLPSGEDFYFIESGDTLSKSVDVDMGQVTGTVQKEVCVGFDVYSTLGLKSIGFYG